MSPAPTVISTKDIATALQYARISTGDIVIVHASLKRLGYVAGDAEKTVIRALLSAVGPDDAIRPDPHGGGGRGLRIT